MVAAHANHILPMREHLQQETHRQFECFESNIPLMHAHPNFSNFSCGFAGDDDPPKSSFNPSRFGPQATENHSAYTQNSTCVYEPGVAS